jgi:hypothetical protein
MLWIYEVRSGSVHRRKLCFIGFHLYLPIQFSIIIIKQKLPAQPARGAAGTAGGAGRGGDTRIWGQSAGMETCVTSGLRIQAFPMENQQI